MYELHEAMKSVDEYYFNVPNKTHIESFDRAKMFAIEKLNEQIKTINRMKIEDFEELKKS